MTRHQPVHPERQPRPASRDAAPLVPKGPGEGACRSQDQDQTMTRTVGPAPNLQGPRHGEVSSLRGSVPRDVLHGIRSATNTEHKRCFPLPPATQTQCWGQQDCPCGGRQQACPCGGGQRSSLASQLGVHCPRSQRTNPRAMPGMFHLLLIKDKLVDNKRREEAGCQAKKLGGNFFLSYFVCTISC